MPGTKEASKFTPLDKLYAIRDNNYFSKGKPGRRKEYDPESVEKLIWEKESLIDKKETDKTLNQYDELEIERLELKELLSTINKHKDKFLSDFTMTCLVNDLSKHMANHI